MKTGQKAKAFNMKHIPTSKGTMTVFSVGESKKVDGRYEQLGFINCIVFDEIPLQDWVVIGNIHEVKLNQYYNKQGQKITQTQVVIDLITEESIDQEYSEVGEGNVEVSADDLPF